MLKRPSLLNVGVSKMVLLMLTTVSVTELNGLVVTVGLHRRPNNTFEKNVTGNPVMLEPVNWHIETHILTTWPQ